MYRLPWVPSGASGPFISLLVLLHSLGCVNLPYASSLRRGCSWNLTPVSFPDPRFWSHSSQYPCTSPLCFIAGVLSPPPDSQLPQNISGLLMCVRILELKLLKCHLLSLLGSNWMCSKNSNGSLLGMQLLEGWREIKFCSRVLAFITLPYAQMWTILCAHWWDSKSQNASMQKPPWRNDVSKKCTHCVVLALGGRGFWAQLSFPLETEEFSQKVPDQEFKTLDSVTCPVVHLLRLRAPNAGGPGLIPGQRTRSHMPQLKIPHAVMTIEDPACHN